MATTIRAHEGQRGQSLLELGGLVLALAGGGAFLHALAGAPRAPERLPTWSEVTAVLRAADVPMDALTYLFVTAAWLVWLWAVGSLVLHLSVAVAEALSHGAPWARSLRSVSERITLPIVRAVIDRAVVAIVVVNLVARPVAAAAAEPTAPAAAVALSRPAPGSAARAAAADARTVEYTVQPGDTLWSIAEGIYGTGAEFPRLVEANAGRTMGDGRPFTRSGVIQPGWVLMVPLPSDRLDPTGGRIHYVVEDGDMLRGIAARFLGDEMRWPEIFEANRGVARLADGRTLTNPDLIWPGLRLRMPGEATPRVETFALRAPDRDDPALRRPATPPVPLLEVDVPTAIVAPAPATREPTAVAATPAAAPREPAVPDPPAVVADAAAVRVESPRSRYVYGAAAVAGAAALGGAFVLRRRARRSLSEPPPRQERPTPSDEFAETGLARALAHRLHGGDAEPAVLAAEHARWFLDKNGLSGAAVVLVKHGRRGVGLLLRCPPAGQGRLVELAPAFGARLGGRGQAWLTPDHDVMLQVSAPTLLGLGKAPERADAPEWLVPVGVLSSGETLHANWRELGHALVASLPGGGADVVLTGLIAALAARCRPEDLELWTIATRRSLPPRLADLPHQRFGFVDPEDGEAVSRLLTRIRAELARRTWRAEDPEAEPDEGPEPPIVLVVGDLAELSADPTTLDVIGTDGLACGIRLLVGTTRPCATAFDALAHCQTRLVLQTLDADQSLRLVGAPDGADLGAGDVLITLGGRMPLRARGVRVRDEHLDELVRLMGGASAQLGVAPTVEVVGAERDHADAVEERAGDAAGPGTSSLDQITSEDADHDERAGAPPIADHALDGTTEPSGVDSPGEEDSRPPANGRAQLTLQEMVEQVAPLAPNGTSGGPAANGHSTNGAHRAAPLIQVQCLGDFSVRSGDREVTPTGDDGGHYKAWEVLAFLAAQPGGRVTADSLVAAVWPDVDAERGRKRLKVVLARLRALLAEQVPGVMPDVVCHDRGGGIRLDLNVIRSDAHEFTRLCRLAVSLPPEEAIPVYQQARALYAGDLLRGRGARYYEWLHERYTGGASLQEQYREEFTRATMRLARLLVEQKQSELAIPLYKELLRAEPTLEDVARELFRCYGAVGDLASLLREGRQLRQALRQEYGDPDDPDDDPARYQLQPETTELIERLQSELAGDSVPR